VHPVNEAEQAGEVLQLAISNVDVQEETMCVCVTKQVIAQ
jgi:hypothetical protein